MNSMVTASYCPKELCLKLRAKGIEASHSMRFEKGGSKYDRYTLDVVCKWLREVHGIHIYAFHEETWCYEIQWLNTGTLFQFGFESYEEAIINAIEETISERI